MAFKHIAAIEQNNLLGGKLYVAEDPKLSLLQTSSSRSSQSEANEIQEITLNGVPIKLKTKPNVTPFSLPKRWTRETRTNFQPKEKEIFRKSATGS